MTRLPFRPAFRSRAAVLRAVPLACLLLSMSACSTLKSAEHWVFGGDESAKAAPAKPASPAAQPADVTLNRYGWLRVEPTESGGRSDVTPVPVDAGRLRLALSELKGTGGGFKGDPVFSTDELDDLSKALADALNAGKAGQDILFAAAGKNSELGIFETETATAARAFVEGGRLNLIFGMTRFNFGDDLRGAGMLRTFIPGQRAKARDGVTPLVGLDWQAMPGRADWLTLDAHLLQSTSPLAQPGTPLVPAPAPAPAATGTPLAPAAAPTAAAVAPAAVAPPAAAAPAADSAAAAERRLSTLQRLRDKGLITEQEFQERRKAVLDGL